MVDLSVVNKAVRKAAAAALDKVPSPGSPDARQGEDCGCGRRKRKMIDNIKKGKSAAAIVKEAMADIRGR